MFLAGFLLGFEQLLAKLRNRLLYHELPQIDQESRGRTQDDFSTWKPGEKILQTDEHYVHCLAPYRLDRLENVLDCAVQLGARRLETFTYDSFVRF